MKGLNDGGIRTTTIKLSDMKKIKERMKEFEDDSKKAVRLTISDLKKKAPVVVRKQVAAVYQFPQNQIRPGAVKKSKDGTKTEVKQAATIRAKGDTIANFKLIYTGRRLTPLHFSMTPKTKPAKSRKYKIRLQILRGKRFQLHGKYFKHGLPFLAPAGKGSTTLIPFQRMGDRRMPVTAIHTTSVPQMIDYPKVKKAIGEELGAYAAERLKYHEERLAGLKEKRQAKTLYNGQE